MAIPDFTISDLASFQKATDEPNQIAGIYFCEKVDYLNDLAYGICVDFRKRPQLYRDLGALAEVLGNLRARYGTEPDLLSVEQRKEIYGPLFGDSGDLASSATDNFVCLRDELFDAASAFAERAVDTGVDMLRASMRNIVVVFQDYLAGLQGDSVRFSRNRLADFTEKVSYQIIRSEKIAAVFGVSRTAGTNYPYNTDPGMDVLIEEISKVLMPPNSSEAYVSRRESSNRQIAARAGATAIATVLAFTGGSQADADLDVVTLRCYQWATALRWLTGQGRRAGPPALAPVPAAGRAALTSPTRVALSRPTTVYTR